MNFKFKHYIFVLAVFSLFLPSCKKEKADALTQKVNTFMAETMYTYYLWNDYMPESIYPERELDSYDLFERLCYRAEDHWSFLTDDYESLIASLSGSELTFGYSLVFYSFSNTSEYFAVVQFVYPDSPAAEQGLERGSILLLNNGEPITKDNYKQLYDSSSLNLTLGVLEGTTIRPGKQLQLTAREMSLNAIIESKVVDYEGHKVGYLCFSDFFLTSIEPLTRVFARFKAEGITDMVLDLRYNLGGYNTTALHLGSLLAPLHCLDGHTIMVTYRWNDHLQSYWEKNDLSQIQACFDASVADSNSDLSRLYVLTGPDTASASELVICSLEPYMDVIRIGSTTYGKYTGASVFRPEEDAILNWALQLIIFRYANVDGLTNFKNGFAPDYEVEDVLIDAVYPLGDTHEALFAKALELITGSSPVAARAAAPAAEALPFKPQALLSRPGAFDRNLLYTFETPLP